jgi:hypothetical protein
VDDRGDVRRQWPGQFPDSTNDRTYLTLAQPALSQTTPAAVGDLIARFSRDEDFNVSPGAAMTKRVLGLLQRVGGAAAGAPDELLSEIDAALQQLAAEAAEARDKRYGKLQPWVEALHAELTATRELRAAETVKDDASTSNGKNGVHVLNDMIKALETPPSIPPA